MSLLKLVLYQVELPTQLYLKYNGVEYRGDRNDIIVAKSVDHFHSVKHSETLITCFFTRPLWLYTEVAQGRRPCHLPLHRNRRGASTPGKWITKMCGMAGKHVHVYVELFLASRNESGVQRTCRNPNRNSICAGFEVGGDRDNPDKSISISKICSLAGWTSCLPWLTVCHMCCQVFNTNTVEQILTRFYQ